MNALTKDNHATAVPLPLVAGERLDQPTFHTRYAAMPAGLKAELIGGVVYMPSPVRSEHGDLDQDLATWLGTYRRDLPFVRGGGNTTTILGDDSEPQPDQHLRIQESKGGLSRIVDGWVTGAPELIVEVGASSRSYDLGPKKGDYERAGVREYVFVGPDDGRVRWFLLREGRYVEHGPGTDGVFRSEVFPGLWLNAEALYAGDLDGLLRTLEEGLATADHAAFKARLAGL